MVEAVKGGKVVYGRNTGNKIMLRVLVTPNTQTELDNLKAARNTTVSNLVRDALDQYLAENALGKAV